MTSTLEDLQPRQSAVLYNITCPPWCSLSAGEHADDLWELAGNCLHWMDEVFIEDTEGYQVPLEEPIFNKPIRVVLVSHASPDGRETASPVVHLGHNSDTLSVQQALALADEIRRQVELYRATGGVA